jgi:primary-amine oxidase
VKPGAGLTLTDVSFGESLSTSTPILSSAALAQIAVTYDDGDPSKVALDLPAYSYLTANIRPKDCPGGQIFADTAGDPVLCAVSRSDGLRYEWSDSDFGTGNHARSGTCLDIYTVTPVDWYTYLNEWTFCDDGSVSPEVGASGQLSPIYFGDSSNSSPLGAGDTDYRMNHFHNVFWRIEFALSTAGSHPQIAQQDSVRSGTSWTTSAKTLLTETASRSAPNRTWMASSTTLRNGDDHPVTYGISLDNPNPERGSPWYNYLNNDVYVTQYDKCEVLAASKPGGQQCGTADGSSVDKYVSGQKVTRPVVWLQTSLHHVPRDEDEHIMNLHWLGFEIMPMGLDSKNPLAGK